MICPNCGHDFTSGNQCPECKLDSVLFTGTVRISDILYNKGLEKAKTGDLSGAIECLTKSVQVNKNNVFARNLLGLTLYETGQVGDALKEWVISQSLMRENNPATAYLEDAHKSGRSLERADDAVRMYNQALEFIRQKSDDMAIIQLKKAVEINPKFIHALNLLTLCYLIQRDSDRAAATVERVLSMDVNNTIALNYFNELFPGRVKPDIRVRKPVSPPVSVTPPVSVGPSYKRLPMRETKQTNFHIAEILSFIIGAACMFAALYVLVMPAITRENDKVVNDYKTQMEKNEKDYQEQLAEKDAAVSDRDVQIEKLEADIADWTKRVDIQERTNMVLNAYGMLTDNKLQEAVDVLSGTDLYGLPSDIIEKAENVITTAYPMLAQEYYNNGVQAYDKDKDYDKALVDFEKAYRYVDEEATYMAELLYYLGNTYAKDEKRADTAIEFLERFVETYPKHRKVNEVNKLLQTLADL